MVLSNSSYIEYKLGIQLLCEMGWGEVAADALMNTYDWMSDMVNEKE